MHSLVKDLMTTPGGGGGACNTVQGDRGPPCRAPGERGAGGGRRRPSAGRRLGSGHAAQEEFPEPDQDIPLFWTKRHRLEREKAAASVARDLMTAAVVSISPEATADEAARRMHTAKVKRLPVVIEGGRLVGIISLGDLLKVFDRPDDAIRRESIEDVIVGEFMMAPSRFFINVTDGVVVLQGRVERRSPLPYLVRSVQGVEGVVRVENRLASDIDDRDADRVLAFHVFDP